MERAVEECDEEKALGGGKQPGCSWWWCFLFLFFFFLSFLVAILKLKTCELEVTILDTQNLHPPL